MMAFQISEIDKKAGAFMKNNEKHWRLHRSITKKTLKVAI